MNSKESLKWLKEHHEYLIKQYFDNPFVSKETAFDLANPKFMEIEQHIEELEKENQELKEKTEKIIDELIEHEQKTFRKYAKCKRALDILQEVVSLNCDKTLETERQFLRLSQEEYELLKEVLEDE